MAVRFRVTFKLEEMSTSLRSDDPHSHVGSNFFRLCSVLLLCCCGTLAGETGIGKSTLMDTLFNNNFDSAPSTHDLPSVKLKSRTYGMNH